MGYKLRPGVERLQKERELGGQQANVVPILMN